MFKRFWWVLLVMFPVGALSGLLVAAVITYVMPKMYESEVVIEVRPIDNTPPPNTKPEGEAPDWLLTEIGKMRGSELLDGVSGRLELPSRWNLEKDQVRGVLGRALVIQSIRGTDLVFIRVRHTNKVDARDIAAEVANSYKDYRAKIDNDEAEVMLRELNNAVRDQEEIVNEKILILDAIDKSRKKNITFGSVGSTLLHLPDSEEFLDAKRDVETEQGLLQVLKLKQIGATIARKIPNESVTIHESPVIAYAPVSPNVTLNLSIGTALGLLLSPLMALPLMWLLDRRKSHAA